MVTLHPLDCGALTAASSIFERGAGDEPVTLPVPAWLVRHPAGPVLFDTGLHPDLRHSRDRIGILGSLFEIHLHDGATVQARLEALDVDAAEVEVVVLSHLHFDHAGGLTLVPNARLVVQSDEWVAGSDPDIAAASTYLADDYQLGHDVELVRGEHDLFGDGLVTCVPTPGHTAGHQSLRVRVADREVVLAADCAYFDRTIDGGPLPPFGYDRDAQARSIERLRAMRAAGATLVPGHDPDVWATLPASI